MHLGSLKRGMQEIDETPLPPPPPSPKKDETMEAQRKVSRKERCCSWKISRKQNGKNAVKKMFEGHFKCTTFSQGQD